MGRTVILKVFLSFLLAFTVLDYVEASSYCSATEFQCKNRNCITINYICDDEDDCGDNSDEEVCTPFQCHPATFQCLNGKCIPRRRICYEGDHCGDNTDEKLCEPFHCHPSAFQCSNGKCTRRYNFCRHDDQCGDNSDEQYCNKPPLEACPPNWSQCPDKKRCIPSHWVCDGFPDCPGESEEGNCDGTAPDVCPLGWFQCSDHQICVPSHLVCDGFSDCFDGSEEVNCGFETTERPISTTEEMPISTTVEIPIDTTEEIPIGTSEEMPIGTTEEIPISTTEQMPNSTNEEMPIRNTKITEILLTSISEETTQQNVEKATHPTVEKTSENNAVEMELKSWLLRRRKPGSRTDRWGSQVHRIAVALHLADRSTFAPGNSTGEEIRYELTIQLLHRLGKEKSMESEELALYIHALLVSCLDPRDFFSHDLVHELRRRVEAIDNDINPFLILVLCSSGDAMTAKDVKKVITGFESQHSPFLTDSQAIASMALSCLSSCTSVPGGDATLKYMLQTLLKYQFKKRTVENFRTTALVTQALLIEDSFENHSNFDLAMKILIDGLDRKECLLNVYYALPVFYRKSLLDVNSDHCSKQTIAEDGHLQERPEVDEATIAVHFSVWMGDEINYVRTWRLRMHSNNSVYDALETVAKIGDVNVIEYDVVDEKPFVTAMNGKENDPELGMFWFVCVKTLKSNKDPEIVEGSPVDIKLNPSKEIILWYKSGLCSTR